MAENGVTFWRQLALFEVEARKVDELLSRHQEKTAVPQFFRKPRRLQHKHWTAEAQSSAEGHRHQSGDSSKPCRGPDIQTLSSVDGQGPDIQTLFSADSQEPDIQTLPSVDSQEPDIQTLPSVDGQGPGIQTLSSVDGQGPDIQTLPSVDGQGPDIQTLPSEDGQGPDIQTLPSVDGQGPDIQTLPSVDGQEPDIQTLSSVDGQGPDIQTLPSVDGQEPDIQILSTTDTPSRCSNPTEDKLVTNREGVERAPVYLSGQAISQQDSISACIDTWYCNAVSCTTRLRLKKPEKLRQRPFQVSRLQSTASICDFLAGAESRDCLSNCSTIQTIGDSGDAANVREDMKMGVHGRDRAASLVQSQQLNCHCAFRSRKSVESGSEATPVPGGKRRSTRSQTVRLCTAESPPLVEESSPSKNMLSDTGSRKRARPDCSSPVKNTFGNKVSRRRSQPDRFSPSKNTLRNRPSRIPPSLESSASATNPSGNRRSRGRPPESWKKTAEKEKGSMMKDGGVESDCSEEGPEAKRPRRCRREWETSPGLTRTTRQQKRLETQCAVQKQGVKGQTTGEVSRPRGRNRGHCGGEVQRHRLRRERRHVVSRTTGLLCCSCKHGLMRSQCLLCNSLDTVTRRIVLKAMYLPPVRKHRPSGAGRSMEKACTEPSVSSNIPRRQRRWSEGRLVSGRKQASLSESVKQHPPRHRARRDRTNKTLGSRSRNNAESRNIADCSSGDKRHSFCRQVKRLSGKESRNIANCSSGDKRRAFYRQAKRLSGKEQVSPGEICEKVCPGRRKSARTRSVSGGNRSVVEDSVIDYHRQVSAQGLDSSATFASTRDMFSQLCQLEERARDYDISTLDTIMPVREKTVECRVVSKGVLVYSRPSHVGGIWKSILS